MIVPESKFAWTGTYFKKIVNFGKIEFIFA